MTEAVRASYEARINASTSLVPLKAGALAFTSLVHCEIRGSYAVNQGYKLHTSLVRLYEPRIRAAPRIRVVYEARTSTSVSQQILGEVLNQVNSCSATCKC